MTQGAGEMLKAVIRLPDRSSALSYPPIKSPLYRGDSGFGLCTNL